MRGHLTHETRTRTVPVHIPLTLEYDDRTNLRRRGPRVAYTKKEERKRGRGKREKKKKGENGKSARSNRKKRFRVREGWETRSPGKRVCVVSFTEGKRCVASTVSGVWEGNMLIWKHGFENIDDNLL